MRVIPRWKCYIWFLKEALGSQRKKAFDSCPKASTGAAWCTKWGHIATNDLNRNSRLQGASATIAIIPGVGFGGTPRNVVGNNSKSTQRCKRLQIQDSGAKPDAGSPFETSTIHSALPHPFPPKMLLDPMSSLQQLKKHTRTNKDPWMIPQTSCNQCMNRMNLLLSGNRSLNTHMH